MRLIFLQVFSDAFGGLAFLERLGPVLSAGFLGDLYRLPRCFDQVDGAFNGEAGWRKGFGGGLGRLCGRADAAGAL